MDDTPPASSEVAVLVPAAGQGRRLGGERKQFRTLGGEPLLVQTLRVFEQHPAVDHIVVAAPPDQSGLRETSELLHTAGLRKVVVLVEGGDSRQASVRRALRAVPSPVDIVLVHDAVRPFVAPDAISRLIDTVRDHGAAALAIPVADTLREVDGKRFGATVPRSGLYRMQTPQGFRRAWLEEAHHHALDADISATDDVELVQQQGQTVHFVEGSAHNFKITTPADWTMAKSLWADWPDHVAQ